MEIISLSTHFFVNNSLLSTQLTSLLANRGASGSVTLAGDALSPSSSLESSSLFGDSLSLLQGAVLARPVIVAAPTTPPPPNSEPLLALPLRSMLLQRRWRAVGVGGGVVPGAWQCTPIAARA